MAKGKLGNKKENCLVTYCNVCSMSTDRALYWTLSVWHSCNHGHTITLDKIRNEFIFQWDILFDLSSNACVGNTTLLITYAKQLNWINLLWHLFTRPTPQVTTNPANLFLRTNFGTVFYVNSLWILIIDIKLNTQPSVLCYLPYYLATPTSRPA